MSEFVECQNCGRTFFAENIECPYCKGEPEAAEPRVIDPTPRDAGGRMFGILFRSFNMVLVGIVVLALIAVRRLPVGWTRTLLGLEATLAVILLFGLVQRRRWSRLMAILFILGNAALGVLGTVQRGQAGSLAWGPGPLALLLFLIPFFSQQARDRFSR
ncbi:MAG: hypothetical protein JSW67_02645 [Candidatus Latescibacterota bacterium]|nr:MAG: hypothetical protein JSW67_02645 [Candidatus Latescibacterota bacterium]